MNSRNNVRLYFVGYSLLTNCIIGLLSLQFKPSKFTNLIFIHSSRHSTVGFTSIILPILASLSSLSPAVTLSAWEVQFPLSSKFKTEFLFTSTAIVKSDLISLNVLNKQQGFFLSPFKSILAKHAKIPCSHTSQDHTACSVIIGNSLF